MMRPILALAVCAALTAPSAGQGAESPAQRLGCQEEARRRIKGPLRIDVELYRRVVERRQAYVQECMANGLRNVEQTGSTSTPLPPRRPVTDG